MTRVAWGMLIVALAGVLMVVSTHPAAAQQTGSDQYTQQQGTAQPPMEQPEAAQPAPEMAQPAPQAQPSMGGEYPDVSGLTPFSPEADYMSVPGYLRWQVWRTQGYWLSYAEARRIVVAQGGQLYHRAA